MSDKEVVISVKNLVKNFGSRRILNGVSLEIYQGETLVIMGGSGCGKSTFLRHLIGAVRPDSGEIWMFGGYVIGVTKLGLGSNLYIDTTLEFLEHKDIFTGLLKTAVFSMIISLVACHQGLYTEGGAEGVGRSTTRSVVTSFILIIVADAVLTAIFYFANT